MTSKFKQRIDSIRWKHMLAIKQRIIKTRVENPVIIFQNFSSMNPSEVRVWYPRPPGYGYGRCNEMKLKMPLLSKRGEGFTQGRGFFSVVDTFLTLFCVKTIFVCFAVNEQTLANHMRSSYGHLQYKELNRLILAWH